jgi:hypothetical protein
MQDVQWYIYAQFHARQMSTPKGVSSYHGVYSFVFVSESGFGTHLGTYSPPNHRWI